MNQLSLQRLLEKGFDPNTSQKRGLRKKYETGITALHMAATIPSTVFDNSRVARALIDAGADVDSKARNPGGVTPLHYAAYYGAHTVCILLKVFLKNYLKDVSF